MQQSLPMAHDAFVHVSQISTNLSACPTSNDVFLMPTSSQVCTPALNILEDMGVLKELVDNNEAHFADSGGFVSPSGLAYIGKHIRQSLVWQALQRHSCPQERCVVEPPVCLIPSLD